MKDTEFFQNGLSSIKFVEYYINNKDDNDLDEPFLRSIYILLSYGFELILKSFVIKLDKSSTADQLNDKLICLRHDFIKISQALGTKELNSIGIKNITFDNKNLKYVINTTENATILVDNFNDIRYKFQMRTVPKTEYKRILSDIKRIRAIGDMIQNHA